MTPNRLFRTWLRPFAGLTALAAMLALSACGGGSGAPNNPYGSGTTIPSPLTRPADDRHRVLGQSDNADGHRGHPAVQRVLVQPSGSPRDAGRLGADHPADARQCRGGYQRPDLGAGQRRGHGDRNGDRESGATAAQSHHGDAQRRLRRNEQPLLGRNRNGNGGRDRPRAEGASRDGRSSSKSYPAATRSRRAIPGFRSRSRGRVSTDANGSATIGLVVNVNAVTQIATIRATDVTTGNQVTGNFTIQQVVDGSAILSVIPNGNTTITGPTTTTCSTGATVSFYVFGGTPPYNIAVPFPGDVTLAGSPVFTNGGHFDVTTNGDLFHRDALRDHRCHRAHDPRQDRRRRCPTSSAPRRRPRRRR